MRWAFSPNRHCGAFTPNRHCGLDPQPPENEVNVVLQSDVEQGIAGQARNDGSG